MDFSKFQTDYCHNGTGVWRTYVFPNGHDASVILDPHDDRPFRFEIESSDPDDLSSGRVVGDLTTEQVEAKLAKLAGLPRNQEEA
jgi:hypothetical protein